jgi:hypothetical protein
MDIDKGAQWPLTLAQRLESTSFGILCLTPENRNAPWLLFEAGALSKSVGSACVCPLLIGLQPQDVSGPLAQFQTTRIEPEDISLLLSTINSKLPQGSLTDDQLRKSLDVWWLSLRERIDAVPESEEAQAIPPTDRQLLEEVLFATRRLEAISVSRAYDHELPPFEGEAFARLSPRSQLILNLGHGLHGEYPHTFYQISRSLGLSVYEVSKLHDRAIEQLREHARQHERESRSLDDSGD